MVFLSRLDAGYSILHSGELATVGRNLADPSFSPSQSIILLKVNKILRVETQILDCQDCQMFCGMSDRVQLHFPHQAVSSKQSPLKEKFLVRIK